MNKKNNKLILTSNELSASRFDQYKNTSQETTWFLNQLSENTKNTFKLAIQQFITFLGIKDNEQLYTVEPSHIIAFRDHLIKEGKGKATINNRLSAVASLFEHLVHSGKILLNPVKSVKRPKSNRSRVKALYVPFDKAFDMRRAQDIKSPIGLRDQAILYLQFGAGLRATELCQLKIKDYYKRYDGQREHRILNLIRKGGKEQEIAIGEAVYEKLNEYLAKSFHSDSPEAPLFPSMSRKSKTELKHLDKKAISDIWNKYSNLEGSTPHSARATFATDAYERTKDLMVVKEFLGHSSIRTTEMYVHLNSDYSKSPSYGVRL